MNNLQGTRTEKNILTAFCGESQARNRYTYFSKKARKEGFIQIANIFEETANQEKEHAKRFFKLLEGGEIEIVGSFPAGTIGTTIQNLKASAIGENQEHTIIYPGFAKIAKDEGFEKVATVFKAISVAEKQHEKRYSDLADNIEKNKIFARETSLKWRCINCGYLHNGNNALVKCPACDHSKAYFELLGENW